jgi:hypothetical protein
VGDGEESEDGCGGDEVGFHGPLTS